MCVRSIKCCFANINFGERAKAYNESKPKLSICCFTGCILYLRTPQTIISAAQLFFKWAEPYILPVCILPVPSTSVPLAHTQLNEYHKQKYRKYIISFLARVLGLYITILKFSTQETCKHLQGFSCMTNFIYCVVSNLLKGSSKEMGPYYLPPPRSQG